MRQVGPPAVFQIHGEERDLAGDIDPAQVIVEFNAVEDDDGVVQQDHIPQMHIAVAFAHVTVPFAGDEIGRRAANVRWHQAARSLAWACRTGSSSVSKRC